MGSALPIMAMIVAIKIANRCQPSGRTPWGTGLNQIAKPIAQLMARGMGLAPASAVFEIVIFFSLLIT
jgi:hypothetical protein